MRQLLEAKSLNRAAQHALERAMEMGAHPRFPRQIQPLDLIKTASAVTINRQARWRFPDWVGELHQVAAYIREVQHENSNGLVNLNWTPGFVCMANADHTARGGVHYKNLKTCTDSLDFVTLVAGGWRTPQGFRASRGNLVVLSEEDAF